MVELLKTPGSSTKILKISRTILHIIFGKKKKYSEEQLKELYQAFVGTGSLLGESNKIYCIANDDFIYIMPEKCRILENKKTAWFCRPF